MIVEFYDQLRMNNTKNNFIQYLKLLKTMYVKAKWQIYYSFVSKSTWDNWNFLWHIKTHARNSWQIC